MILKTILRKLDANTSLCIVLLICIMCSCFANIPVTQAWAGTWVKRIKFTIDHTRLNASLTNFPLLLHISDSSGINGQNTSKVFDELGSNYLKINVTDANDIPTQVEIEKWDSVNRQAYLWINATSISSVTDTDFYIYYDHTQANNTDFVGLIGDTAAKAVWDSNFTYVYHMTDITTSIIPESVSDTTNNATKGAANTPLLITAAIDGSQNFTAASTMYATSPTISMQPAGNYTFEAYVNATATPAGISYTICGEGDDTINKNEFCGELCVNHVGTTQSNVTFGVERNVGAWFRASSTTLVGGGSFYHVAGTYDGVSAVVGIYVNGALENTVINTENTSQTTGNQLFGIGVFTRNNGHTVRLYKGTIDEVRISKIVRSQAWLNATCWTEKDSLMIFGSEETSKSWHSVGLWSIQLVTREWRSVALWWQELVTRDWHDILWNFDLPVKGWHSIEWIISLTPQVLSHFSFVWILIAIIFFGLIIVLFLGKRVADSEQPSKTF